MASGAARSQLAAGERDAHARSRTRLRGSPARRPHALADWANLTAGPAALIAALVLSGGDLAGYVRFRAVCAAWRACSDDPRAGVVFDRRFHPRRWIMLPPAFAVRGRRPFLDVTHADLLPSAAAAAPYPTARDAPVARRCESLANAAAAYVDRYNLNTPAGASPKRCLVDAHVRLPDPRRHRVLGATAEGLVVLCRKDTLAVQLLNPLTGQRADDLPPATTLLKRRARVTGDLNELRLIGAGLAGGSTLALHYGVSAIAVAKSGDPCWTLLRPPDHGWLTSAMPMASAGRFYCVTSEQTIIVVEAATASRPAQLAAAAAVDDDPDIASSCSDIVCLGDNNGELVCVLWTRRPTEPNGGKHAACRVDLGTGSMAPVRGFGGNALFMGMGRSVLAPPRISRSIAADTMYVCYDCNVSTGRPDVVAIDLLGRCSKPEVRMTDVAYFLASYVCS
ncbi:hypothetical protein ACP4OV_018822 [Aristida adscensionis]